MSSTLFDRNPALQRLRDEGFDIALSASNNHLLVRGVPYLVSAQEVRYGILVAPLEFSGDLVNPPRDHVLYFIGEQPCDLRGNQIAGIMNASPPRDVDTGLRVDRTFSGRPAERFADEYEKITAYVLILEGPAQAIDHRVTARTFPPYEMTPNQSVFRYADTASSRAKTTALSQRLEAEQVAIVGLGGTGSYVLDFLAKTPIKVLHVFDGDIFSSHNAFRAPGAASLDALRGRPTKVAHHKQMYENMRHEVVAHDYAVTSLNVAELEAMDFVFLCIDGGPVKRTIVEHLVAKGIPFIDTGMGLDSEGTTISGLITTTTSTPEKSDHLGARISFADAGDDDEYGGNIQVAELNALNAAIAVIKWKKLRGYYAATRSEHFTVYTLSEGSLINEDDA
jgi:hypothetical protein